MYCSPIIYLFIQSHIHAIIDSWIHSYDIFGLTLIYIIYFVQCISALAFGKSVELMYNLIVLKQIWQHTKRHQHMSYILEQIYYLQRKFRSVKYSNRLTFCDRNRFSVFVSRLVSAPRKKKSFIFIIPVLASFHPYPLCCPKCSQYRFTDLLLHTLNNKNKVKPRRLEASHCKQKKNKNLHCQIRAALGVQNEDIIKVTD